MSHLCRDVAACGRWRFCIIVSGKMTGFAEFFWLRCRQEAPEAVCAGGEAEKFAANEVEKEGKQNLKALKMNHFATDKFVFCRNRLFRTKPPENWTHKRPAKLYVSTCFYTWCTRNYHPCIHLLNKIAKIQTAWTSSRPAILLLQSLHSTLSALVVNHVSSLYAVRILSTKSTCRSLCCFTLSTPCFTDILYTCAKHHLETYVSEPGHSSP